MEFQTTFEYKFSQLSSVAYLLSFVLLKGSWLEVLWAKNKVAEMSVLVLHLTHWDREIYAFWECVCQAANHPTLYKVNYRKLGKEGFSWEHLVHTSPQGWFIYVYTAPSEYFLIPNTARNWDLAVFAGKHYKVSLSSAFNGASQSEPSLQIKHINL